MPDTIPPATCSVFGGGSSNSGSRWVSYATVEASNLSRNLITVRTENGALMEYAPGPFKGVEVFRAESRTLASGDQIQFRAPDRALGVAHGEFAAVIAIDGGQARLRTDKGRSLRLRTPGSVTSIAATPRPRTRARRDGRPRYRQHRHRTKPTAWLTARRFYLSMSRTRHDARIYTDNA
jgi:hypothetical protein